MLSYRGKRILFGILVLGILWSSVAVARYATAAGSTPALSSLLYPVGLVFGFSAMLGAILLDPRKPKSTDLLPLTQISRVFLGVVITAIVAAGGFLYYYLTISTPEKTGFSPGAYSIGFLIGFLAVFLVYYLPEHLPHEENQET